MAGRKDAHGTAGASIARDILEDLNTLSKSLKDFHTNVDRSARTAVETDHTIATQVDVILAQARGLAMMRLSSVLDNMHKVIRDLSRDLGKPSVLTVIGGELEADKRILDHLKEPLIHLLRNSIDHGIETSETRASKGKTPEGQIEIVARQLPGGKLEIVVKDDGEGLDLRRIEAIAVKREILREEEAKHMSPEQIRDLIFHPHLSTKQIVTDISGRGVGMAAVRRIIEILGGTIQVDSKPGEGSEFRMIVPTTVSTARGLLVEVGKELFLVPCQLIVQVEMLKESDIFVADGIRSMHRRGAVVPVLSLSELLGIAIPQKRDDDVRSELMIFKHSRGYVALTADCIFGEQEAIVKSLNKPFVSVPNILGMTLLPSGEMIPVLNPVDLIESALNGFRSSASTASSLPGPAKRLRVLVADDAITSRMLFRNILASHGFEVSIAADGEAALQLLKSEHFDLVVTDIQMPRFDGLQLTREIRRDAILGSIPVILITSMGSREEIQRGVDAGADAYFVKSKFDQENLLATIRRLV